MTTTARHHSRVTLSRAAGLPIALLIAALLISPLHAFESSPASVTDISDRAYEPAVKKLLTEAKTSIVMSMYAVSLGTTGNNPLKNLLAIFLDAAERGVSVTLYLNTRFKASEKVASNLLNNPFLNKLKAAGAVIHIIPSSRMLHDKVIIVDSRYIAEGSANWSLSALRSNFESNTLIDSPGLAAAKLERLSKIPLEPVEKAGAKTVPLYMKNLPAEIGLRCILLEDRRYFPEMVRRSDDHALNLYLILLAHVQATGRMEFLVDLETMGLSLGLPRTLSDARLRKEITRCLYKLERQYGLVKNEFFYGRDARVTIEPLPGEVFTISSGIITPDTGADRSKSIRQEFFMITRAYLASKGEDIDAIASGDLSARFCVGRSIFYEARQDPESRKASDR